MEPEKIRKFFQKKNFLLTEEQSKRLSAYIELLLKWNSKTNIVGVSAPQNILEDLIMDSLHLYNFLDKLDLPSDPLVLDLGAGAGLPGIPLRLFWDKGQYYLIEIREKRFFFLRQALRETGLHNTYVHREKAENLSANLRRADMIISRAFLPQEKLLPLAQELLNTQGRLIVMGKSPKPTPNREWSEEARMEYHTESLQKRYLSSLVPNISPS